MTFKSNFRFIVLILGLSVIILFPFIVSAQTSIDCGQTVSGSIDTAGEKDLYSFTASAGDVVTLRTRKISGNLSPYMEVYGPSGSMVWQGYTQMDRTLAQAGTYTLVLRDDGNVKTGSYLVYWERLNSPCNVVGEITCGQLVSGAIGSSGDSPPWRVHRMSLSSTETVRIRVSNPSGGNFYPYVELYNGAGALVTTAEEINRALSAGTYTLLVRDAYDTYGGGYKLTWKTLLKPCSGNGTALGCGQVISASVEGLEEIDVYTFEVSANDVVTLRSRKTSGNLIPYMEVYGPSGAMVWQGYTQMDRTLTQGGIYTVLLRDDVNTKTGSYLLYWEKLNNPCNVVGEITCGQLVSGTVGTSADSPPWRVHRLNLSSPETVRIRVSNTSAGTFYPYVELYNGSGSLVTTADEINRALSAGAYTLLVRDAYDTHGGSYNLKFQNSDSSCPEVVISAPNGGEIIEGGSNFRITWTFTSPKGIVSQEVKLSTDGGKTFPNVVVTGLPGNVQSFDWIAPTDTVTTKGRIQVNVTDASGMSTPDDSDTNFIIVQTVRRTYEYDKLGRLIKIIYENGKTVNYTYDAVGNRLTLSEE